MALYFKSEDDNPLSFSAERWQVVFKSLYLYWCYNRADFYAQNVIYVSKLYLFWHIKTATLVETIKTIDR